MTEDTRWEYLEKEPAEDAPIVDNPSGMYCPDCRAMGSEIMHCHAPEWCGGMRLMRPKPALAAAKEGPPARPALDPQGREG